MTVIYFIGTDRRKANKKGRDKVQSGGDVDEYPSKDRVRAQRKIQTRARRQVYSIVDSLQPSPFRLYAIKWEGKFGRTAQFFLCGRPWNKGVDAHVHRWSDFWYLHLLQMGAMVFQLRAPRTGIPAVSLYNIPEPLISWMRRRALNDYTP